MVHDTNVRDYKSFPGRTFKIRYNGMTRFLLMSVTDGQPIYDNE